MDDKAILLTDVLYEANWVLKTHVAYSCAMLLVLSYYFIVTVIYAIVVIVWFCF